MVLQSEDRKRSTEIDSDGIESQFEFRGQSAIGILTLNWKSDNYGKTINDIKIGILALKSEGIIVSIEWIPGHADIQGNELADQLAKKAAQEAEKIQSIQIFTKQDIQKGAKDSVKLKWQSDGKPVIKEEDIIPFNKM
ncbi:Hypothetical predicted protein [Mytilus galloprovincialis]|uniref:RNase H type-1 domain-containing protein n=1 Tax=Mytilus galloprovincialis TaxID=29158 RepID=A0A8B6DM75_MYTGA|nr:Hypothetical predicted protein [Mytilus galloprovincialis]